MGTQVTLNLTRKQLETISKDHRIIRQLEKLVSVGESVESGDLEDEIIEAAKTFETVSQGLDALPKALSYTLGKLTQVVYTKADLTTITKTLTYVGDQLSTITLSGNTPADINLTKTLIYSGDILTGASYS